MKVNMKDVPIGGRFKFEGNQYVNLSHKGGDLWSCAEIDTQRVTQFSASPTATPVEVEELADLIELVKECFST